MAQCEYFNEWFGSVALLTDTWCGSVQCQTFGDGTIAQGAKQN